MKIGDIVKLKSGGYKMTVEDVKEDDVHCVWFDKEDSLQRMIYKKIVLEEVK